MDPSALWASLSWQLAAVCTLSFVLGGVGGLMHLATVGADPPPVPPAPPAPTPASIRPAPWLAVRRFLVGGVAAVAVLYITNPTEGIALVGGSIAAGYAGQVVLNGLEARITATLAQAQAVDTSRDLRDVVNAHGAIVNGPSGDDATRDAAVENAKQRIAAIKQKHGIADAS